MCRSRRESIVVPNTFSRLLNSVASPIGPPCIRAVLHLGPAVNRRVAVDRHTGSARPASSNRHFSRVRPRGALARAAHAPPRDPGDKAPIARTHGSTTHTARRLTSWCWARQCAKRTEPDDVSVQSPPKSAMASAVLKARRLVRLQNAELTRGLVKATRIQAAAMVARGLAWTRLAC
jgi:hypothetical protein